MYFLTAVLLKPLIFAEEPERAGCDNAVVPSKVISGSSSLQKNPEQQGVTTRAGSP